MADHFTGSPFHTATAEHVTSCLWYSWDSFVVPDIYSSMRAELSAIRTSAGLIDMSPLPKTEFRGPDAGALLDKLMTRPVQSLTERRCLYSPWCDTDGNMVGDGLIFRVSEDSYLVAGENSLQWYESQKGGLNVEILDRTKDYGILSLQGPKSQQILSKAVDGDWKDIGFSELAFHSIAGQEVIIARQGFTGERGYEVWTSGGDADVWQAIYAVGLEYGALPAGEFAVDTARVEAGLILVSADYTGSGPDHRTANVAVDGSLHITPIDAGLARLVDFDGDRDFVGKQALVEKRVTDENLQSFVGLKLRSEDVLMLAQGNGGPGDVLSRVYWGSTGVFYNGDRIGRASSHCWSPTVGHAIAFGCLRANEFEIGDTVQVEMPTIEGEIIGLIEAEIVDIPFFTLRRSAQ